MKPLRLFTILLIIFVILTLMMCLGIAFIPEAIFHLLTGWFWFLKRSFQTVQFSPSGFLSATFFAFAFLIGFHLTVIRKLTQNQPALRQWKLSVLATSSIIILFAAGVSLVALTHQVFWLANSPEDLIKSNFEIFKKLESQNQLREIRNSENQYLKENGSFTVGGTFNDSGTGLHSWETFLLPYLSYASLFNQIDFERSWRDPIHSKIFETHLGMLQNPGYPNIKSDTESHYALNSLIAGINRNSNPEDSTDGSSNTIFAGEINTAPRHWGDPFNFRDPASGFDNENTFGSVLSTKAVQFLMADGSIRSIHSETDPKVLKALSTPSGGEQISADDF